jgi:hypothetical protein
MNANDLVAMSFLLVAVIDELNIRYVWPRTIFKNPNMPNENKKKLILCIRAFTLLLVAGAVVIYVVRPL